MSRGQGVVLHYRDGSGSDRSRSVRVWRQADRGYRADFRAFADVGGGLEAVTARGERRATCDPVLAQQLAQARLDELLTQRQAKREGRVVADPLFADYATDHLAAKAGRRVKASTVARDRHSLDRVEDILGAELRLSGLTVPRLRWYVQERRRADVADQTILNELHAVSNLWTYARADALVTGDNPVPAVKRLEHVEGTGAEASWLETGEAWRLLEGARALDEEARGTSRCPYLYAIIATYLLTGGRKEEILGLERADLDLDGGWVHVRPNRWRTLKSPHSQRAIPLWPQLRRILESYLQGRHATGLLFPSHVSPAPRPYSDLGEALAAAVQRAEIDKPVTWHTLRHTYASARLYTLEGGAPVSVWDVACELGHRDTGLIERTYGHVLRDRDRRQARVAQVAYERPRVLQVHAQGA